MNENMISLEAVNCFETWMKEVPMAIDQDPEKYGNRLLELAMEYEVEDLNELIYLFRQYWPQLEEYIPSSARYTLESCLHF